MSTEQGRLTQAQERGNRIVQRVEFLKAGEPIDVEEFSADVRALLHESDNLRKLLREAIDYLCCADPDSLFVEMCRKAVGGKP